MKQERVHGTLQRFYKLISPPPPRGPPPYNALTLCICSSYNRHPAPIPFQLKKVLVYPYKVSSYMSNIFKAFLVGGK